MVSEKEKAIVRARRYLTYNITLYLTVHRNYANKLFWTLQNCTP